MGLDKETILFLFLFFLNTQLPQRLGVWGWDLSLNRVIILEDDWLNPNTVLDPCFHIHIIKTQSADCKKATTMTSKRRVCFSSRYNFTTLPVKLRNWCWMCNSAAVDETPCGVLWLSEQKQKPRLLSFLKVCELPLSTVSGRGHKHRGQLYFLLICSLLLLFPLLYFISRLVIEWGSETWSQVVTGDTDTTARGKLTHLEPQRQSDSRCLRAGRGGAWPTFGFPGESTASCPGSCSGPSHPATANNRKLFLHLNSARISETVQQPKSHKTWYRSKIRAFHFTPRW